MPRRVAVEGEVSATVGTTPYTGAQGGTWSPRGPVATQAYDKLTSGGKKVIWQAKCTFDFVGTNSSGATVKGSEDVTLAATPATLQGAANGVLLDGDKQQSSYGNTLQASAGGKLQA